MNNFYIYIYLDPRKFGKYSYKNLGFLYKPIYIGKGKDDRYIRIDNRTPIFINKFNKIKKSGLEPIIIKLYKNLSEEESLKKEIELIDEIGRLDLGNGPLLNMTDGGDGVSGYKHKEETKKKLRKNYQDIKKEFERRDCILLTKESEYKDSKQKLEYICQKGHEGSICWNDFQQGKGCPIEGNKLVSKKLKGENNPKHKLTEEQVVQIKLLLKEGKLTIQKIADMFGVNRSTISNIKAERIWSHIKI